MLVEPPEPRPPVIHPVARRLVLTALPAMVIAGVMMSTIWGDHGLLHRHALTLELERANTQLARIERSNQELRREVTLMDRDPVVLERIVADELGWAKEGAVLYRFEN